VLAEELHKGAFNPPPPRPSHHIWWLKVKGLPTSSVGLRLMVNGSGEMGKGWGETPSAKFIL